MIKYKKNNFTLAADHLDEVNDLQPLYRVIHELDDLNKLLWNNFIELRNICHFGAIDYNKDLLVIFAKNNATFYKVNLFIPKIQDVLSSNRVRIGNILVKVSPEKLTNKSHKSSQIDDQRYKMLEKFAELIQRPDLLKPQKPTTTNESDLVDDWQIKL